MEKETNRENFPEIYDYTFHNVKIHSCPDSAHVVNDDALGAYMGYSLKKARKLAGKIQKEHRLHYGKSLRITNMSLAVELLGHYTIQEICFFVKKTFAFLPEKNPLFRFSDWLIRHMEVIDCGEKEVDNNRFVWDLLSIPADLLWKIENLKKKH